MHPTPDPAAPLDGTVALRDWGVIAASGVDAATFLQGQLTNDVMSMATAEARLAGFCSAKGRLQASFVIVKRDAETFWLACAADLLAPTLKRLSMFVMRAKCKLVDASSDIALFGSVGATADASIGGAAVYAALPTADGIVARLADVAGLTRALRFGGTDATPSSPSITLADWRALEVRSGIVTIEAATVDRFVPQMVNFELVGGVDFQKGCYPGQEVVARSQYRGTVKRRTVLFACAELPKPGDDVFHSSDPEGPSGTVANAAAIDAPGERPAAVALVEVKLALLDDGSWHLGAIDGAALTREPLPYAMPAAETESAAATH